MRMSRQVFATSVLRPEAASPMPREQEKSLGLEPCPTNAIEEQTRIAAEMPVHLNAPVAV